MQSSAIGKPLIKPLLSNRVINEINLEKSHQTLNSTELVMSYSRQTPTIVSPHSLALLTMRLIIISHWLQANLNPIILNGMIMI